MEKQTCKNCLAYGKGKCEMTGEKKRVGDKCKMWAGRVKK